MKIDDGKDRSASSDVEDEAVGYGRPPKKHQFRKGQSGNPKGRPRKKKKMTDRCSELGSEPAREMLRHEAYRMVTIREGDQFIEMPTIQAVFRAMGVSALKGNRFAQQMIADMVRQVEADDRQSKMELFETAVDYKANAEEEIRRARQLGQPEPEILPHPDDIVLDINTGSVRIRGPQTKEEKKEWDRLIGRRDAAQEEVSYFAKKHRQARSDDKRQYWLDEWHFEQKMFDMINDKLPERYQIKLEDRSWEEGASRPGESSFDDDMRDNARRVAFGLK